MEGTPLFLGRGPDLQIDATSISRSGTGTVLHPGLSTGTVGEKKVFVG